MQLVSLLFHISSTFLAFPLLCPAGPIQCISHHFVALPSQHLTAQFRCESAHIFSSLLKSYSVHLWSVSTQLRFSSNLIFSSPRISISSTLLFTSPQSSAIPLQHSSVLRGSTPLLHYTKPFLCFAVHVRSTAIQFLSPRLNALLRTTVRFLRCAWPSFSIAISSIPSHFSA